MINYRESYTMVGLVGHLRKPKLPTVPGSPHEGNTTPTETPITPQRFNPPVLRNFSYPINVGILRQPSPFPSLPIAQQTAWDQLGELCNFSPDSVSRTRESKPLGLDDPFPFRSETESYSQLDDEDSDGNKEFGIGVSSEQLDRESLSQEDSKSAEKGGLKDKALKLAKGQSLGDHIFPQTSIITSRLKRNSSGQHKTTASLDTSRLMSLPSDSPDRPASSSGVPLIDTTVKLPIITTRYVHSPVVMDSQGNASIRQGEGTLVSQVTGAMESLGMDPIYHKKTPHDHSGVDRDTLENARNRKLNNPPTELAKHNKKDGKSRWISLLKSWVNISEPSAQALKQSKKETYDKAHLSLDGPQVSAKLHLPTGTLSPNAIKPVGSGPDPEEMFLKQAEQRKRMRRSGTGSYETYQGSKSSSSCYSASSSIAFGTAREVPQ
ncbi:hypothetical protein F4813DRAFT_399341 [Daldinia decipiens]|uniref:uncharacterized protein n=1 Tax=Daldinia decipiens TaxID=326647 RepID=UPI0020C4ACB2|nr:uncharacterized protein F4813DRAFT_399341 [Daldinia decipiens]KAI1661398.1 hypothetical protein F4813DRAFT_399341 [Daldinia decipiens]